MDRHESAAGTHAETFRLHGVDGLDRTAMMARKGFGRDSDCYHCGQMGHWRRKCPVKVYQEKMGICSDDEKAKGKPDARIAM